MQAGSGDEEVWAEPGAGGVRDDTTRGADPGDALGRDWSSGGGRGRLAAERPAAPPPPCGLVMVPVWPCWCLSLSLCLPLCCLYCSLLLVLTIS